MAKYKTATERRIEEGERYGVFDSAKVYNQHAIARILGMLDPRGECSKYVLRNMLHAGLPFMKVGRHYLISGHHINLWVQEHAKTWAEHFPKAKAV